MIRFPDADGSLKRPHIAIFYGEPPISDEAIDVMPTAIIEIISIGYEDKDIGPDGTPFYLDYIPDVLVVDPRNGMIYHYRDWQPRRTLASPATVDLACGYHVTL